NSPGTVRIVNAYAAIGFVDDALHRNDAYQMGRRPIEPATERSATFLRTSILRHRQTGHHDLRVVRETQTIGPVSGFQLAAGYEHGPVISGHHRPVDRAFDIDALNRERDSLNDGLALFSGLVNSVIGLTQKTVHLERRRSESPHDKPAVSVRGAIEVGLIRRSHVVAADEHA